MREARESDMELSEEEKAGPKDGPRGVANKLSTRLGYGHETLDGYDKARKRFAETFPGYGIRAGRDGVYFEAI